MKRITMNAICNSSGRAGICLVFFLTFAIPLRVSTGAELLRNGSFEEPHARMVGGPPINWLAFASTNQSKIGVDQDVNLHGKQSCRIESVNLPGGFSGIAQSFTAEVGRAYTLRAFIRPDPKMPLKNGAYGQIALEWKDARGAELYRSYGPTRSAALKAAWKKFEVTAVAPQDAVFGVAVVTLFSGEDPAGPAAFYVDQVSVTEARGGP